MTKKYITIQEQSSLANRMKKHVDQFWIAVMTIVLILLPSVSVYAQTEISTNQNIAFLYGQVRITGDCTLSGVNEDIVEIFIADGVTVTFDNLEIDNPIMGSSDRKCAVTVEGTATITLLGNNKIKSGEYTAGINVPPGKTLTICGSGTLDVTGGIYGAGIGGNTAENCGTVTISESTVSAIGGIFATGIGGGSSGMSGSTGEIVDTSGGTINISDGAKVYVKGNKDIGGIGNGGDDGSLSIGGANTKVFLSQATEFTDAYLTNVAWTTTVADINTAKAGIFDTETIGGAYLPASPANAEVPTIDTQTQDLTCNVGDNKAVSIEASVTDGGTLSYQWYSNTIDSSTGGTAIPGATAASYTVSTTTAGTSYYYCIVSNTNNNATTNQTATTTSYVATILVQLPNPILSPGTYDLSAYPSNSDLVVGDGSNALSGVILYGTNNTMQLTLKNGADITLDGVSIDQGANKMKTAVTIEGTSTITLKDGSTNTIISGNYEAGIYVSEGKTLTIDGTGTLYVIGGYLGAGIGAGYGNPTGETCGTVIINNGIIYTLGGLYASCIGGGAGEETGGNGGTITINNGTIMAEALAGNDGVGIGGGYGSLNGGNGGTLTITGGSVTATGSSTGAAGIGGGSSGLGGDAGDGTGGTGATVNISGGTITATGWGAAGIGGGFGRTGGNGGTVTISGGTVTTIGNAGAGMGGGFGSTAAGNGGDVTITGGAIYASGDYGGEAIGKGGGGTADTSGSLNISGTATKVFVNGTTKFAGTEYYTANNFIFTTNASNIDAAKTGIFDTETIGGAYLHSPLPHTETPSIDTQPSSLTCHVGDSETLILAASTTDGGILSFQWYSNATNSNTGGSAIAGATTASYTVPTITAGTSYYYCVVTNTNSAATTTKTTTATSNVATVVVQPPNPILTAGTYNLDQYPANTNLVVGDGTGALSGVILHGTNNTMQLTIKNGADVTFDGVTIEFAPDGDDNKCAVSIDGKSIITLNTGTTNTITSGTSKAGINVPEGKTLTINGSGTLNVTGGYFGAGIGGDRQTNPNAGTINIMSGTVNAIGGAFAAGIGGSSPAGSNKSGGNGGTINISGGTITAKGGHMYAAGIGGAMGPNAGGNGGNGGTINITGGTVNATGAEGGTGIGGGGAGSSNGGSGGNITIAGGTVIATGGNYTGVGIGGGFSAGAPYLRGGSSGTILITGDARVIANGTGNGTAIGGGTGYDGPSGGNVDIITIEGNATVTATGAGTGAGIGSGCDANARNYAGKGGIINIGRNATVIAIAGNSSTNAGAGIGGAGGRYGGPAGSITITGSPHIYAQGGKDAMDIGDGANFNDLSSLGLPTRYKGTLAINSINSEPKVFTAKAAPIPESGNLTLTMAEYTTDGTTINTAQGTLFAGKSPLGAYLPKAGDPPPNPILTAGTYQINDYAPNTILAVGNGTDALSNVILQGTNNTMQLTIKDQANVTLDGATIALNGFANDNKCAVTLEGTSTITLNDGSTNTIASGQYEAGISVAEDKTLTIEGTGTLITSGGGFGAGIGTGYGDPTGETCGTVIINNGTIIASGGKGAACIGGGAGNTTGGNGGNITINGGTVTAVAVETSGSVGIGGGYGSSTGGDGGMLTVTGGTITSTGDHSGAAGIGGGASNVTGGNGATVNISGGTVTATGWGAAGIGGGIGNTVGGNGGAVTISGGLVNTTGNGGAGIGGGFGGSEAGNGGDVSITGGAVYACGNYGSEAIGASSPAGTSGTLSIKGTTTKVFVNETAEFAGTKHYDNFAFTTVADEITAAQGTLFDGITPGGAYIWAGYLITYENLNGVDNSNNPVIYEGTADITLAAPQGLRNGYTFKGWYDAEINGNKITSIPAGSTGNTTLWAKWLRNPFTVSDITGGVKITGITSVANFKAAFPDSIVTFPQKIDGKTVLEISGTQNETENAFHDVQNDIKELKFEAGSKVEKIRGYSFYACENLLKVTLPESITDIGSKAFFYCKKLHTVSLAKNSSLTTLEDYAFAGCDISALTIPASVNSIGTAVFDGNPIDSIVFDGCTSMNSASGGTLSLPKDKNHIAQNWKYYPVTGTLPSEIASSNTEVSDFNGTYQMAYTITYHNVGSKNASENPSLYTNRDEVILSAPSDSTNYTFEGWYRDAAHNNKVPGTGSSEIASGIAIATGSTGDTTFYANWLIHQYTLTYHAGGNGKVVKSNGSGGSSITQTINHGSNGSSVTAVPYTGYHFVAWSDGSINNPRTDKNITKDLTIKALFKIDSYTLSYKSDDNGSISGKSKQTVEYGAHGTAVTAVPAIGYQFLRWSDGVKANPRTDIDVTDNITVTAMFERSIDLSDITKDNGEKIGEKVTISKGIKEIPNTILDNPILVIATEDNPHLDILPLPDNKEHGGARWVFYPQKGGEPEVIEGPETAYKEGEYKLSYLLKYIPHGGELNTDTIVPYYAIADSITFPEPYKLGYKFIGWIKVNDELKNSDRELKVIMPKTSNSKPEIISGLGKGTSGNITVEALWDRNIPTFNIIQDNSFCNSTVLKVEGDLSNTASYTWNTGETDPIISVDQSGSYSIIVKDNNVEMVDTVNVKIIPTVIVQKWDNVLLVDNSTGQYANYQWFKNGVPIDGATGQYYREPNGFNGIDSYSVLKIMPNGTEKHSCEFTPVVGRKSTTMFNLKLYPNPGYLGQEMRAQLRNELMIYPDKTDVRIFDIYGKIINATTNPSGDIDLRNMKILKPGIYIIHVKDKDGHTYSEKLIVK